MLEGDRISHLLILREGRVKVTSTTPDGRELLLAVRGPGDVAAPSFAKPSHEKTNSRRCAQCGHVARRQVAAALGCVAGEERKQVA